MASEIIQLSKILQEEFHSRLDSFSRDFSRINSDEVQQNTPSMSQSFAGRLFDLEPPQALPGRPLGVYDRRSL
jgi:hypothetical protein